jgi:hypothetical protein
MIECDAPAIVCMNPAKYRIGIGRRGIAYACGRHLAAVIAGYDSSMFTVDKVESYAEGQRKVAARRRAFLMSPDSEVSL